MGDLAILEREAELAERRATALRKLVEVARDLGDEGLAEVIALVQPTNGNGRHADALTLIPAVSDPPEGMPRGRQAIRMIVHEQPGLWALADLRVEMKRRGWFTSSKGVDVAVTRMCAKGEARRVGKGRYEFFAPAIAERGSP
jgi:hypothetical protein